MSIPDICNSIEKELSNNLRHAANDAERQMYHYEALKDIGEKLIPALNRLMAEKEEGSELEQARVAALNVSSFVCIGFIRTCANFNVGVTCLDKIADNCREPQLKKKLVSYTNQLKTSWNRSAPGGIAHNPRAKKILTKAGRSSWLGNLLRITLLFGGATYFFTHIDLASLISPGRSAPEEQAVTSQLQNSQGQEEAVSTPQVITAEPQIETKLQSSEPASGRYYMFTDKQGVIHIVDDPNKVPPGFRVTIKDTNPGVSRVTTTPVTIRNNQVLVPVTLSLRGRVVEARLLLDTGASVTAVGEHVAAKLGVMSSEVTEGRTTIADGRSIGTYSLQVDTLAVGSRSLNNARISIIPRSGYVEHDGLLGMNFLKNYRYHVDFSRSVIEWGG